MEDWAVAVFIILFVLIISALLVKMLFFKVVVAPEPERRDVYKLNDAESTNDLSL